MPGEPPPDRGLPVPDSPEAAVAASDPLDPGDSVARNTGASLAAQLITAAFTAFLTVYLARVLEPEGFGVFSLALGISAVLVLPADFGIAQSVARYVAERRRDRAAVADLLTIAARMKLAVSGLVCVAMALAAGPVADAYGEPDLAWALRAMALVVFGQSFMMLYNAAFTALARSTLSIGVLTSKSVVELAASVAIVAAGGGAAGAAFGRAAGFLAGAAIGFLLVARRLRLPRGQSGAAGVDARKIAGYAGALLVIEGSYTLFEQVDVLLIGAILTATAAGLFQAPLRLVTFLHYPGYAVASGVAPRLARQEGRQPETGLFIAALRYVVLLQIALTVPAVVWATPLVDLVLGAEYAESAEVLRALGPFIFLSGIAPLVSVSVNYLGQAGLRVPIAVGAVLVNIAIDAALIPEIGIVAGAVGTNVAFAIYVPAHLWICKRVLGLPLRPLGVTFARGLVAGAAMAGVLALFGTSEVSLPAMLGGGALGLIAYALVLLGSRELSRTDLEDIRRQLS